MNIKLPGEEDITTRERLHEFIDRGFAFYGTAVEGGERIRIRAVVFDVVGDVITVVVGVFRCQFVEVHPATIAYGQ